MSSVDWQGKPYYSLDAYFKAVYGKKCYKIAVNAGCTCPNRDGSLDTRGCIFCSAGGSGDFAFDINGANDDLSAYVNKCIDDGTSRFTKALCDSFVIYFQAFTNTYGDLNVLGTLWKEALYNEKVVGISIATRPDCLGDEVLALLRKTKETADALGKFVWVELGLQTIHEKTAGYIRRHYPLSVYDEACEKLYNLTIPYIVHVILGLPDETRDMMMATVRYVCQGSSVFGKSNVKEAHPFGIKLQLLHVLERTDLARDYRDGLFNTLKLEEYIELVCDMIEIIPEDVVIHRITGDAPKNILVSPSWSADKKNVLNSLHKRMKERGVRQGLNKANTF